MKKGQYDKLYIEMDEEKAFDSEMKNQFKMVDKLNCFAFVEGIDTESCAYKYLNQLNFFRYQYAVSFFFLLILLRIT